MRKPLIIILNIVLVLFIVGIILPTLRYADLSYNTIAKLILGVAIVFIGFIAIKYPKFPLKSLIILLTAIFLALGFVFIKYSNFSGECKEEGRILTKEEIIKRAAGEIYKENPYCCAVSSGGWLATDSDNFFSRLFGYYNYQIHMFYKREPPLTHSHNDPYYERYLITDECGHSLESHGIVASEKSYRAFIDSRKISQEKGKKHEINND